MTEWGNLNCYFQQGWEGLNDLIKIFFRKTNKGGHGSRLDTISCNNKKSKLIPIIKLVQRCLLFICKLLDTDDKEQVEILLNDKKRDIESENNEDSLE